jgi:hypothetical protein
MQDLSIHDEVAAFLAQQATLSETKENPWVVFAKATYQSRFSSFEAAYEYAVEKFEVGKFLIRDIRGQEPFIPLMYANK